MVLLPSGRDKTKHCLLVLDRRYVENLVKNPVPFKLIDFSLQNFLKQKLLPTDDDGNLYARGNFAEVFVQNLIPFVEPTLARLEYVGMFYSMGGQIKYFFYLGKSQRTQPVVEESGLIDEEELGFHAPDNLLD
jgi:hypothetical protein